MKLLRIPPEVGKLILSLFTLSGNPKKRGLSYALASLLVLPSAKRQNPVTHEDVTECALTRTCRFFYPLHVTKFTVLTTRMDVLSATLPDRHV